MIDSDMEDSSSSNSDLEEYMCAFIEEHEEEYKYINLGWPKKCYKCCKLVANKYYSNRLVEINSAESQESTEILENIAHSIEKPKSSSLITINCKIEISK